MKTYSSAGDSSHSETSSAPFPQAIINGSRETISPARFPLKSSNGFARQIVYRLPPISANAPGNGLLTPLTRLKTSRADLEKSIRPSSGVRLPKYDAFDSSCFSSLGLPASSEGRAL